MADLMTVLTAEDIVPKRFVGIFTGPLTRQKILDTVAAKLPFFRNTSFLIKNATKMWLVTYDITSDEYWSVDLTKAN